MKVIIKLISLAVLIGFISCKKDTSTTPEPTPLPVASGGVIKIQFLNMVDTNQFMLNQNFVNPKGDTVNISKFNYYISNIVITKNDNSTFVEPNSYHLVEAITPSTSVISLTNVPEGSYKSISFMLGVDSARNCSGAQDGDLDPARDMSWGWSTGYIMVKIEGTSPKSSSFTKSLTYHIGGYGGVNKTQRNFNFNFASTTANVSKTATPLIHLSVNINEFFKTPNLIDVVTQFNQGVVGPTAKVYADNYADMISFKDVQN